MVAIERQRSRRRLGRGGRRLPFLRRIARTLVAGLGFLGLHFGSGPPPVFVRLAVGPAILVLQRIGSFAHAILKGLPGLGHNILPLLATRIRDVRSALPFVNSW
jgi:hypothetical protein